MRLGLLSTLRGWVFSAKPHHCETLSKVDPNENAYISSSWERYENRSVHSKMLSVFMSLKSNKNALVWT